MAAAPHHARNPGFPLDMGWVLGSTINRSSIERRAATHLTRRSVKKQWQVRTVLPIIYYLQIIQFSLLGYYEELVVVILQLLLETIRKVMLSVCVQRQSNQFDRTCWKSAV